MANLIISPVTTEKSTPKLSKLMINPRNEDESGHSFLPMPVQIPYPISRCFMVNDGQQESSPPESFLPTEVLRRSPVMLPLLEIESFALNFILLLYYITLPL